MRAFIAGVVLCLGGAAVASAQPAALNDKPTTGRLTPEAQSLTEQRQVTERGQDFAVWEWVEKEAGPGGQEISRVHRFVELETGKHYLDETSGKWNESKAFIQSGPNGAVADQGPQRVIFRPNVNDPDGAIDLTTPDNKRLRASVLALVYYDASTGSEVILGVAKDALGVIVGDNQVVYAGAFDGLKADVVYTYSKAGLMQEVVLGEQPPSPEKLGLDPANTRLQVMTEWMELPDGVARKAAGIKGKAGELSLEDETLDFGAVKIGAGKAFWREADDAPGQVNRGARVGKQLIEHEGRTILIESVPVRQLEKELEKLPVGDWAKLEVPKDKKGWAVRRKPSGGKQYALQDRERVMEVAAADAPRKSGVSVDWSTVSSTGTLTLQGDTTYFVSGSVTVDNLIIEGGTVVKYTNTTSAKITVNDSFDCRADDYRPAIFTAQYDNGVGQTIGSGTISTNRLNTGLVLYAGGFSPSSFELKNVRISHMGTALDLASMADQAYVRDSQIINCTAAISSTASVSEFLGVYNVLIAGDKASGSYAFYNWDDGGVLDVQHATVRGMDYFHDGWDSESFTNCLVVDMAHFPYGLDSTSANLWNTAPSAVFETSGGGDSYLASGSTNRNAGTVNIAPVLLGGLKKLTTYPPVVIATNFTGATVLQPQVQRDTDIPDLGYHYPPLDFTWTNRSLSATLVLTNGVAVAVSGAKGLSVSSGSILSRGDPVNLNRLVCNLAVQERGPGITDSLLYNSCGTSYPVWQMDLRFTEVSAGMGGAQRTLLPWEYSFACQKFILRDCFVRGLSCDLNASDYNYYGSTYQVSWTNNVFEYCDFSVYQGSYSFSDGNDALSLNWLNNLFRKGSFSLNYLDEIATPYWVLRNNLFDGVTGSFYSDYYYYTYYVTASHNGFTSGTSNPFAGFSSSDKTGLTNNYQKGPLGRFYYPTTGTGASSLTNLFNTGYLSATNYGLYHFTTTTNQVKETNSVVDIGFHYVAVGTNGLAVDTDFDGLGDWVEDVNGDGAVGTGETSWIEADSDFDGIGDGEERTNGTDPLNAASKTARLLASFRFNTANWVGDQGQLPILTLALTNEPGLEGQAVPITGAPWSKKLNYRTVEPNGKLNMAFSSGTVAFWFKPNWASTSLGGTGPNPAAWGRLFNFGEWTSGATYGFWDVGLDPGGTQISVGMQDGLGNSSGTPWGYANMASNTWVHIAVTYSPAYSAVYFNGTLINGAAWGTLVPPKAVRDAGFFIGSDTSGHQQAQGSYDLLETYNYPLSASQIASNYVWTVESGQGFGAKMFRPNGKSSVH